MLSSVNLSAILTENGVTKAAEKQFVQNRSLKQRFDGQVRDLYSFEQKTAEYRSLFQKAAAPWITRIIDCHVQPLTIDGFSGDARLWDVFLSNGMRSQQDFIFTEALTYGHCYVAVLPASQSDSLIITPMSPVNTYAHFSPFSTFPEYVLQKVDARHWRYIDSEAVYDFTGTPDKPEGLEVLEHGYGLTPVVRVDEHASATTPTPPFADLVATAQSLTETRFHIAMSGRKSSFPRLWATGLRVEGDDAASVTQEQGDIFASDDPATKFGAFPSSDMKGLLDIKNSLLGDLSQLSSTPTYMFTSNTTVANLSAEALGSLNFSFMRAAEKRKNSLGEGINDLFRLMGSLLGIDVAPSDTVHWDYIEPNNLGQVGDFIVKMNQVGIPLEHTLSLVPGFDQQITKESADYVASRTSANAAQSITDVISAKADAVKKLLDLGIDLDEAKQIVGLY